MRTVREPFTPVISPASVVTIGKFDGVHLGHRAVLAAVTEQAAARGVESAVVTFDRNPLAILRPDRCPPAIVDLDRRLELLAGAGVDVTAVLRFDEARARQSAEDFVLDVLVARLGARAVLVGRDFRFGAGGAGNGELLAALGAEHGFVVLSQELIGAEAGDEPVSSSRIRALIAAGEVEAATRLLASAPALSGEVVRGNARGRELGFPTANLAPDAVGIVPADGVYAGWATVDASTGLGASGARYPAAISVSDNPTFGDVHERRVEAYLIDADLDLYGKRMTLEFVTRLRGIEAFDSVDELLVAMRDDVERAKTILA